MAFLDESTTSNIVTCPLCARPVGPWRVVSGKLVERQPTQFARTLWCDSCAYGFVHPTRSKSVVADDRSRRWTLDQDVRGFEINRVTALLDRLRMRIARALDRGVALSPERIDAMLGRRGSTVLHIGRAGGMAAAVAELGHRVEAIEVDAAAPLLQTPSLAGRTFDCIVMRHVLERCVDPEGSLANLRPLLGPSGFVLCEVPNNAATGLRMSGPAWPMLDVPDHLHFFTGQSLERLCTAAGLFVAELRYAEYTRQFTNTWLMRQQNSWVSLGGLARRPSRARSWLLLAKTFLGRASAKYDSVWVRAERE